MTLVWIPTLPFDFILPSLVWYVDFMRWHLWRLSKWKLLWFPTLVTAHSLTLIPIRKISFIYKVYISDWETQKEGHTPPVKKMFLAANFKYIYYFTYRVFWLQSWASLKFEKQPNFISVFRHPHEDFPSWAIGSLKSAISTGIAHGEQQFNGSAIWICGVTRIS